MIVGRPDDGKELVRHSKVRQPGVERLGDLEQVVLFAGDDPDLLTSQLRRVARGQRRRALRLPETLAANTVCDFLYERRRVAGHGGEQIRVLEAEVQCAIASHRVPLDRPRLAGR